MHNNSSLGAAGGGSHDHQGAADYIPLGGSGGSADVDEVPVKSSYSGAGGRGGSRVGAGSNTPYRSGGGGGVTYYNSNHTRSIRGGRSGGSHYNRTKRKRDGSSSSNTGAPNVSAIPGGGPQWTPTSTHHHHHLPTHATVSTMSHVAGDHVNGNVVLENGSLIVIRNGTGLGGPSENASKPVQGVGGGGPPPPEPLKVKAAAEVATKAEAENRPPAQAQPDPPPAPSSQSHRSHHKAMAAESHSSTKSIASKSTQQQEKSRVNVWNSSGKVYANNVIGLHEEIEDFFRWMMPTPDEHRSRIVVVKRLCHVISTLWPDCKVDIFGSFKTGLYLPTSDIDLVILGKWEHLPLFTLHDELVRSGIPRANNLMVLDKAAVPIVKMTDAKADVKVDISFNTDNGIRAATLIKFYKQTYPPLAKLIYVLKQFLLQRNLNEVFSGGLSSYALILMAVSFLQLHPRPDTKTHQTNLAVLLIEFFELYGRNFNYSQTGIRVKDGGAYVPRDQLMSVMRAPSSANGHAHSAGSHGVTPCIEDPLDVKNDVGRGSFQFYRVKSAFEEAYITLTRLCSGARLNTNPSPKSSGHQQENRRQANKSILSCVIEVTQEVVDFRTRVEHQQPLAEASPQQGNNSGAGGTGVGGGHRHRGSLPGAQGSHQDSADRSPGTNASSGTEKSKENNLHSLVQLDGSLCYMPPEDPMTPVYAPPSPSVNVTPNELPDRHFLQLETSAAAARTSASSASCGNGGDEPEGSSPFKVPPPPTQNNQGSLAAPEKTRAKSGGHGKDHHHQSSSSSSHVLDLADDMSGVSDGGTGGPGSGGSGGSAGSGLDRSMASSSSSSSTSSSSAVSFNTYNSSSSSSSPTNLSQYHHSNHHKDHSRNRNSSTAPKKSGKPRQSSYIQPHIPANHQTNIVIRQPPASNPTQLYYPPPPVVVPVPPPVPHLVTYTSFSNSNMLAVRPPIQPRVGKVLYRRPAYTILPQYHQYPQHQ